MSPAQLLAHFDHISDAPDAIQRLRRFILDLAVRGKLVEHDPTDEPASELLKRIRVEKARLVQSREIGKQEPLPPLREDETPFELPETWTWTRVGELFQYDAGTKREPSDLSPDLWLLELEDIEKDTGVILAHLKVRDRNSLSTKSEFGVGDILYGKLRPYLNKVVVAPEPGYSTTEIVAIRSFLPLCSTYCSLAFRRPDFVEYVTRLGRGTKMPRLRTPDALVAVFPLPPLNEQHRIVAKVDELMALCDRLEAAQAERESRRDRLVAASFHHMNNGADDDACREHARFTLSHLPRLTTRPEHIQQLRQTILDLAVRGKLAPQNPNDEPLATLAPARLTTAASAGGARDVPFELPKSWRWEQLGHVSELINGDRSKNYPNKAEYVQEGVAWINTGHIEPDGTLSTDSMHYITRKKFDSLRSGKVCPGDLVYCLRGATLGKTAIITQFQEGAVASSLVIIRLTPVIDSRFAYRFLTSPLGRQQIYQFDNGSAQPNLSANNVKRYWIPLPPLAEQHRIVAKVDKLMALVDELETQLAAAQTERRRLLEAVLREALAPVA